MRDDDLHGGMFDHIPDTNRDGNIDMRDYHSWMDNADGDPDDNSDVHMSDDTYFGCLSVIVVAVIFVIVALIIM